MFDEYFQRKDVLAFIKELETSPKYRKMVVHKESQYGKHIREELALYLFYDIIFKYKIIIDDPYLFEDFLCQVEKIFRKIDVYDDLVKGIQKLFIRYVGIILDVEDSSYSEERREIATYIYDKYIMEGYFVHGFSTVYEDIVRKYSFVPEHYPNRYPKMIVIQDIFHKYKTSIMDKNFFESQVSFTDDFVMGCYYSIHSPGYFHQLLTNEMVYGKKVGDGYLKKNYRSATSIIKKYMSNYSFSDSDRKLVMSLVEEEWNLLHRVPRKISLIFVKRKRLMNVSRDKLEDYLESEMSLQEIVDRIFSSKCSNVSCKEELYTKDFEVVSLEDYYRDEEPVSEEKEIPVVEENTVMAPRQLLNSYGMVSILLITGSLFITLGVIVSIIMILRGM